MKHYLSRNILAISHQLSRTGSPMVLMDMVRLLLEEGNEVTVISMEEGPLAEEFLNMGVEVSVEKQFLKNWEKYFSYFSKFDCVICNTIVTFEAIHILNYLKVPTLWWIHEPKEYFSMMGEVLQDFGQLHSNITVAAVSPVNGNYIRETYGISPEILSFGIRDRAMNVALSEDGDRRPNQTKVRFLCIGSYSYTKGQDLLVEAIREMPEDVMKDCEFLFCGDEEFADEKYLDIVKKTTKQYPVRMIGSMSKDALYQLISEMDFVICPSRMETFSAVTAESMMLGTPVFLSDGCGVLYQLKDYPYVFERENSMAIKEALLQAVKLRGDALAYKKVKSLVRNLYLECLSEERFRDRTFELLQQIVPVKRLILLTGNYDILDIFTHELAHAFSNMGYEVFEFDCSDLKHSMPQFGRFMEREGHISAVLTFNFYSTFMELKQNVNVWRDYGIPVITYLMDHPFCFHENLLKLGESDIVLCPDKNHMNYVTRFYPNVTVSGFLAHGGIEKFAEKKPINQRSIEVLYAGGISLPNIEKTMPDFSKYDFDAKALGQLAYEYLIKHHECTTEEVLEMQLYNTGIFLSEEELPEFIADMHYVDLMVVSHFREKVIRTLAEAGIRVTLFGFGWEMFDWIKELNVDYRGRVSAYEIIDQMADAKIVLSTMTWFKDGTHDRVFNGQLQGAFAITDTSNYMVEEYRGLRPDQLQDAKIDLAPDEEIGLFELDEIDKLPGMIEQLLSDESRLQRLADNGYRKAKVSHTWEKRALELDRDLLHYL